MRLVFVLSAAAMTASAVAQVKLDASFTYDSLSGGNKDWRSGQVSVSRQIAPRRAIYGVLMGTERFGRKDSQFTFGAYTPIKKGLTLLTEAGFSPTHHVLAKFAGTAQLQYELGDGWVAHGGLTRTEFNTDSSTGVVLGVERYFGRYRAAYFLSGGKARNAGFALGHRLSFNDYVNDRTTLGLNLSFGQEVESVGVNRVLRTNVFGASVSGRMGISKDGAISAEIGYFKQGDLYVRRSFTLGYRHVF